MEGMEDELNVLILEYLRSRGHLQSVATLETEFQHRTVNPTSTAQTPGLLTQFMHAFDHGDRVTFFDLWDQYLPAQLKSGDPTSQSLEFNASVYFAVYPLKAGIGSSTQSMSDFKSYLENRGAMLAQSQEFAIFCALPYVPDPMKHPTFKTIFTDFWTIELKARLEQFLRLTVTEVLGTSFSGNSRLLSIYVASKGLRTSSTAVGEVAVMQKKLSDMEQHYEARLRELQTNYHTLVGISMELVETLESSISGQPITSEYIHGLCSRLFGSAIQQGIDLKRPGTSTALLRASVTALTQSVQLPRVPSPQQQQLDYPKVKSDLVKSSNSRRALLLQAIRWRLTRSLAPKREQNLRELITNDILGCAASLSETQQCTIAMLLSSGDAVVQEHAARLVNAFCSMGVGRAYISQSTHVVRTLCRVVVRKLDDSHTQRNILGSIQKISLKRPLQTMMIDAGLPQWLIQLLKGVESLSDYSLRYALALLMNLTLRTAGKKACIPSGPIILRLLGDLLEYNDTEVRSYVNGILYSLLSVPELRSEANTVGLGELLGSSMKSSPPELKSQLKYILGQLTSDSVVLEDSGDDADNEEDEEDPEVIEGDEEETMIAESSVSGESLLATEYMYLMPLGTSPKQTYTKKLSEAPHMRPVTPLCYPNRPYTAGPVSCTSPEMGLRKATARSVSTAK